jgi:hypothetical protein
MGLRGNRPRIACSNLRLTYSFRAPFRAASEELYPLSEPGAYPGQIFGGVHTPCRDPGRQMNGYPLAMP